MTRLLNPPGLPRPRGYSHGVAARGEALFVAGQIGCDANGRVVSDDLVEQFARALKNALRVVRAAGGSAQDVTRLTIYVTDKSQYRSRGRAIGVAYREAMGRHYPAMTLVEVKGLFDDRALVELEATAMLAGRKIPKRRLGPAAPRRPGIRPGTTLGGVRLAARSGR